MVNTMNDAFYFVIPLILGFILDLLVGDPYKLPHPIRWFGNIIYWFERKLNTPTKTKVKGLVTVFVLVTMTYITFLFVIEISKIADYIYYPLATILVFYGLANRNLIDESLKVEKTLSENGLNAGRKQLSFIVGRDTKKLTENQVRVSVLETLSENLSDGVIAPLFYYMIGGLPLMFTYKMINTLDSMIGYKNERYKQFGFYAAKLDDIANYIPARLTALLMVIISFKFSTFKFILKHGNSHSSPNSGFPESALAGILDCRFGGPNEYHGKLVNKPYIGVTNREINYKDVKKACLINLATSILFICAIIMMCIVANLH